MKPKETRLRDWNSSIRHTGNTAIRRNLKPKETRLRDWNGHNVLEIKRSIISLTLETKRNSITRLKQTHDPIILRIEDLLETKRNSITRLKQWVRSSSCDLWWGCSWNQKKLDYEIETWAGSIAISKGFVLETKRNSITRLKLAWSWTHTGTSYRSGDLKPKETRLRDWNCAGHDEDEFAVRQAWNQKKLDYEIETQESVYDSGVISYRLETKRNSITRLKPLRVLWERYDLHRLKPKETRLRDWNFDKFSEIAAPTFLETKRNSITRLKQYSENCAC